MGSRKQVVLINQFFWPDMAATSQLLTDLARALGARGWDVVVLTGRGSYARSQNGHAAAATPWQGVTVRRLWCTNFGRARLAGRLCDYASFLVSAVAAVAASRKPDAVVCLSTPPFVAIAGVVARWKGSRFVYKVEDLYPDVAIALGMIQQRSITAKILRRISKFILHRADAIVALDHAMFERLRCLGGRRIELIPNWADDSIRPDPEAGRAYRTAKGLENRLVVLYSGNLGLAHRFDSVIEAARECSSTLPRVLFLFVGNGPRLDEVKAGTQGLGTVRFMDYRPREELNALYNAADVHLVTIRDEVAGLLFPSKYPAALAAGKPVLLVGGRGVPLQHEIRTRSLGWTCAHDASDVMNAIRDGVENPAKRRRMGQEARRLFDARYSSTLAMQHWNRVLASLGGVDDPAYSMNSAKNART